MVMVCFSVTIEHESSYALSASRLTRGRRAKTDLIRATHNYEIPIVVPQGTRFVRVEFVREKYDPRSREKLIIDLPGGI
jgi:hypothetical protein